MSETSGRSKTFEATAGGVDLKQGQDNRNNSSELYDQMLGVTRSQTVDPYFGNLNFKDPQRQLQRGSSNADMMTQAKSSSNPNPKHEPSLQRSHSLNHDVLHNLNQQFNRSLNLNLDNQNQNISSQLNQITQLNQATQTQQIPQAGMQTQNQSQLFQNQGYNYLPSPYFTGINPGHGLDTTPSLNANLNPGSSFPMTPFLTGLQLNSLQQQVQLTPMFGAINPSEQMNNSLGNFGSQAQNDSQNHTQSYQLPQLWTPNPFSPQIPPQYQQYMGNYYMPSPQQYPLSPGFGPSFVPGLTTTPWHQGLQGAQTQNQGFSLPPSSTGDIGSGVQPNYNLRGIGNDSSDFNTGSIVGAMQNMTNIANLSKSKGELMLEELRTKMKNSASFPNSNVNYTKSSIAGSQTFMSKNIYLEVGINWDVKEILGFVYDFARDQFGSRFIQFQLENEHVSKADKDKLFTELMSYINPLCKDVFGNYVVQKLLDINVGTKEQHNYIYQKAIKNHMYELSTHMYGCRVIQKLIEQIFGYTSHLYSEGLLSTDDQLHKSADELEEDIYDMRTQDPLLHELKQDVLALVTDQNGNHVIQKCIEQIRPISRLNFFFNSFKNEYVIMSKHPYGCRVVQRVLEHASLPTVYCVINEILGSLEVLVGLVQDQYANYVVQHVVEHQHSYGALNVPSDDPEAKRMQEKIIHYRENLFNLVSSNVLMFSQHKFGSNVVECCLKYGAPSERDKIIDRMLESNTLIMMMKDPYANYVVQKVIDKASPKQLHHVMYVVNQNEPQLRRLTYGKHIINKMKQLHQ